MAAHSARTANRKLPATGLVTAGGAVMVIVSLLVAAAGRGGRQQDPDSATVPAIMASQTADRSGAVPLNGLSVSGPLYIFVPATGSMRAVEFHIDDPELARTPFTKDDAAPFDLAGSVIDEIAMPYDLTVLPAGTHTMTVRVEVDGVEPIQVRRASFYTTPDPSDAVLSPSAAPSTPSPSRLPPPAPEPTASRPTAAGKQWHPGFYLRVDPAAGLAMTLNRATGNTNLAGVAIAHTWAELEPAKGAYQLALIRQDLAAARSAGKRLILQIVDRTFSGGGCVPAYLRTDAAYAGGQQVVANHCTALRWVPAVQDRLIALYSALGTAFDTDPTLEAVFVSEDSVEQPTGFDKTLYVNQQKRGMTALAKAFPHTVTFKSLNWGPGIADLFAYARQLGVGVASPNLMPDSPDWATPYYPQYFPDVPILASAQEPRLSRTVSGGVSVQRLFDYALTDSQGIHANYVIWDQPETPTLSYTSSILPLIQANHGKIRSTCPRTIVCQ